jgi:pantoate--beta-alanine ligase
METLKKPPTLCLNMIVKNESKIITRLLESVASFIDTYCICDTGSTDNTPKIIQDFFNTKNIKGKIVYEPFQNFEHNRNFALRSASGMADYLLLLDAETIYSDNYHIQIYDSSDLGKILEAEFRPGHFIGMLTVVLKFLNIVRPTRSYYGEKDYQQLLLIKKMAQALFLQTEIVACPTLRALDGLALSSRNTCLSSEQRAKASYFPTILKQASSSEEAMNQLKNLGFKVDYVSDHWGRRLAALYIGEVRLIDALLL